MTPQQMREAHPLISTSPSYRRYLDAKRERETSEALMLALLKPLTIFFTAVAAAHEEHQRMLHAPAVYLGTKK